jgi:hypothetical protein
MTKYKEYIQKMIRENKVAFETFQKQHDDYSLNPDKFQETYNEGGEKILEIIREYENRLCANTERGQYVKFSGGLAEKFQAELRKIFPMIDYIGLKTTQKDVPAKFSIKKIHVT